MELTIHSLRFHSTAIFHEFVQLTFLQVFALVYPPMYGFNIGETGLVFTCIVVGCLIAMVIYFSYLHFFLIPDILKNGLQVQEYRLRPALIACVGPIIGLFIFGKLQPHMIGSSRPWSNSFTS
jgi:hypothetical protein